MTLFPVSRTLAPQAEYETRNSDSADSSSTSFDLHFLPGMVISVRHDDTATVSTGGEDACVSAQMLVSHAARGAAPANVSAGTTDSSALTAGLTACAPNGGGCASQFRFPFTEPAMVDLGTLLLLLGGYVALLVETAEQGVLEEASAE